MPRETKLGVGVLGATGYIGSPYRSEIREVSGARIVALCARRRDLLERAGREDDADLITDDWRAVVQHPEVDFVVVATPDALHREAVLACAAAGKHVLCEKPVGLNVREAHSMWSAYRDAPERLAHFVPFWTRYVDIFQRAREIVDEGTLGEVRGVVYRWHNPRPAAMPLTWRDDPGLSAGGSIADVGSHAYDTVRWLLGDEARRVLAHADTISPAKADLGEINLDEAIDWGRSHALSRASSRRGGTVDYASVAWEFAGGAVGVLVLSHATYFRKGIAPELELHGTEASIGIDRLAGELVIARNDREPDVVARLNDDGFGNRFEKYVFPAVRSVLAGDSDDRQLVHHPDLEDGWRVQTFTDAAALSVKRGGWVELAELEEGLA